MKNSFDNWKSFLADKSAIRKFLISFFLLAIILAGFFYVLAFTEQRKGFEIEKGWLDFLGEGKDYSPWIFSFTYSSILAGLIFCFRKPSTTLLLIRTYFIMQLLRSITLLVFPLEPPLHTVHLNDPFLQHSFYNGRPNLKDLFFSGHVATIVMFIPVVSKKWLKYFLATAAIVAGTLLIIQRVHYIADVAAAPLFSLLAFLLAAKWSSLETD